MKRYLFLIFASTGIFNSAQESTIQTDRPDQTESPAIIPINHLQTEIGFMFEKQNKDLADQNKQMQAEIQSLKKGRDENEVQKFKDWLEKNVKTELIIYDPYFGEDDIVRIEDDYNRK